MSLATVANQKNVIHIIFENLCTFPEYQSLAGVQAPRIAPGDLLKTSMYSVCTVSVHLRIATLTENRLLPAKSNPIRAEGDSETLCAFDQDWHARGRISGMPMTGCLVWSTERLSSLSQKCLGQAEARRRCRVDLQQRDAPNIESSLGGLIGCLDRTAHLSINHKHKRAAAHRTPTCLTMPRPLEGL